jgi:hypothetical protein
MSLKKTNLAILCLSSALLFNVSFANNHKKHDSKKMEEQKMMKDGTKIKQEGQMQQPATAESKKDMKKTK